MIEPFPNCFSIWESATSSARDRSSAMIASLPETRHQQGFRLHNLFFSNAFPR
jgi:hypothetical protein